MRVGEAAASRGRSIGTRVANPTVAEVVAPAEPPPAPVDTMPVRRFLAVDRSALRAADYFPEPGAETRFANYYRQIKRPILQRAFTAGQPMDARLVMFTSALPGDG